MGTMQKKTDSKMGDGSELTPEQEAALDRAWDKLSEPVKEKSMRFKNSRRKSLDADNADPVDPVNTAVDSQESQGQAMPVGAQFITGLHAILMEAAKFYNENSSQLEPEVAEDFKAFEKGIMGTISTFAQKLSERYPDLPGLDGAEWQDPDTMPEEDEEIIADDDAETGDPVGKDGEEVVVEDGDVVDDTDSDSLEDDIDDDDEELDEEEVEIEKRNKNRKYFRLKDMLVRFNEKQHREEQRRTKIQTPSAVDRVKSVAAQLREIHASSTVNINRGVRMRLKSLRHDLLQTLSNMDRPAVVTKQPNPAISKKDEAAILKAVGELSGKLAKTRGEIETLATSMGG